MADTGHIDACLLSERTVLPAATLYGNFVSEPSFGKRVNQQINSWPSIQIPDVSCYQGHSVRLGGRCKQTIDNGERTNALCASP